MLKLLAMPTFLLLAMTLGCSSPTTNSDASTPMGSASAPAVAITPILAPTATVTPLAPPVAIAPAMSTSGSGDTTTADPPSNKLTSRPPSLKRWLVKCERMAAEAIILEEVGVDVIVKKYRVALAEEEQQEVKGLVSRGRAAAYRQTHARILLLCDENQANGPMKDEEIARALQVGTATVERVRRRCVEEGLERALGRRSS